MHHPSNSVLLSSDVYEDIHAHPFANTPESRLLQRTLFMLRTLFLATDPEMCGREWWPRLFLSLCIARVRPTSNRLHGFEKRRLFLRTIPVLVFIAPREVRD